MTTLRKIILAAGLVAVVCAGSYEAHVASVLRTENESLRQKVDQQVSWQTQLDLLQRERDDATNRLAALLAENAARQKDPQEVLRLRGEVTKLINDRSSADSASAVTKLLTDPGTRKMLRDQQKFGMSVLYRDLAKRLDLTSEQTGKLNDLLADHIMDNLDLTIASLHDGKSLEEMAQLFAGQEATLDQNLQLLAGQDGVNAYKDYSQNLLSYLAVAQFGGSLTGDQAAKEAKSKQLYDAMQQETQTALTAAGLPADYQAYPGLNFRSIASESAGEQNLQVLTNVFNNVAARASSFLSPAELEKFNEFQANALKQQAGTLMVNRKLLGPQSK